MSKKQQGFTIMELMIVIVIVGIISSIAASSYSNYSIASKRTDGRAKLHVIASTLEKCRAMYGVYNSNNCSIANGATITSDKGLYSIKVTSAASSFSLKAKPASGSSQASDTICTEIILNNLGQQTGSGSVAEECW